MSQDNRDHPVLENLHIEAPTLTVETRKLSPEEPEPRQRGFWYPLLVGAGLVTATSTVINLIAQVLALGGSVVS